MSTTPSTRDNLRLFIKDLTGNTPEGEKDRITLWELIEAYLATKVIEIEKAYGGCHKCYGKGYATAQGFVAGGGKKWKTSPIKYCTCDRGRQLSQLTSQEEPKDA